MRERNTDGLPLAHAPTSNPGVCPDQETDQQPSALWDDTQPTELRWSGLGSICLSEVQSLCPSPAENPPCLPSSLAAPVCEAL